MKIVIFNAKYSENLGDGILAHCLEAELSRVFGEGNVKSLCLTGRTSYSRSEGRGVLRRTIAGALKRSPAWISTTILAVANAAISGTRLRSDWASTIATADCVVVGGGHLISDAKFYFPLRLAAVGSVVRKYHRPVAFYAVGVSRSMSPLSAKLIRWAFPSRLRVWLSARDDLSRELLMRNLDEETVEVVQDPGLLAAGHYSVDRRENCGARRVALGVMELHRDEGDLLPAIDKAAVLRRYVDTTVLLVDHGFQVTLFTNGLTQDESLLDRIMSPALRERNVVRAKRPTTPADLAGIIAQADVIVAHRMHSNIVAYSFGRPSVALAWDSKLVSFMAKVDRSHMLLDWDAGAHRILDAVNLAFTEGYDVEHHRKVITEAGQEIDTFARNLSLLVATA